jgi:hypothetical protein
MEFVRLFVLKSKVEVCRVGYTKFGGSVVEEKSSWLWFRVEDRKTHLSRNCSIYTYRLR